MLNLNKMLQELYAMEPEELTARLCAALDESGIPYTMGEGQIEFEPLPSNTVEEEKSTTVVLDDDMRPSESLTVVCYAFAIDDCCLAA